MSAADPATSRRAVLTAAAAAVGAAAVGVGAGIGGLPAPLAERCRFGAWAAGPEPVLAHHQLEASLGVSLPIVSWFQSWDHGWDATRAAQLQRPAAESADDVMIAWEAWGVSLADIANGHRDAYLGDYFRGAATHPGRVVIRPFHEMNGDWYPWAVAHQQRLVEDVETWQSAWRRVVTVARQQKASNVSFFFCANADDVGGVPMEQYWPGAEWVDAIGLDTYNWGWHPDGSPERSAHQAIAPMYQRLIRLHPQAPVMIGELACASGPGASQWYHRLLTSRDFPRLKVLCFFSEQKERDWRLDADPGTVRVLRAALSSRRHPAPR